MELHPAFVLNPTAPHDPTLSRALVLLQRSIRPLPLFKQLWRAANHRICADGAANWLFYEIGEKEREAYVSKAPQTTIFG